MSPCSMLRVVCGLTLISPLAVLASCNPDLVKHTLPAFLRNDCEFLGGYVAEVFNFGLTEPPDCWSFRC